MNWPKSRYTALLEQQVAELKTELAERKQTTLGLYADIAELRLQLAARPPVVENKTMTASDKKEHPLPKSVNWLRARGSLEGTDMRIEEQTDKEKSANGSR